MTTALYRKSSGEVLKISVRGQSFNDADSNYFGALTDPALPDGNQYLDPEGGLRVLGFAKIYDGSQIRNATQIEINGFAAAELADSDALDATWAKTLLQTDPAFRRAIKAIIKGIIAEDERVRAQWEQFKSDLGAAANLAAIKTAVAAYPALPARTMAQALTFIVDQVAAND